MTYERLTALPGREVLRLAEQVLTDRIPIEKVDGDRHSIRMTGGDGTVEFTVHRHGLQTSVYAETDQVRTSRLDAEVQYVLTLLPYQPGDSMGGGAALPGGLSAGATK